MGELQRGVSRVLRAVSVFALLPFLLFMNACRLVTSEDAGEASSGLLTARVKLINPGATSDYSGSVWILPRYFPQVWPLDVLAGCRALDFESDPRIKVQWQGPALVITHDRLTGQAVRMNRCYGRQVLLRERASDFNRSSYNDHPYDLAFSGTAAKPSEERLRDKHRP